MSSISIVIPAYNEALRLPRTLQTISEYASRRGDIGEVIVVDDGSRDNTASVVQAQAHEDPRIRLVWYSSNSGKGYAVRRGVLEARGETILISDADLSTPIDELSRLEDALTHADVAIGSRAIDESTVHVAQAWHRQQMGKTFNRLMRTITAIPFRDTQCGFKLLKSAAAREIFASATIDRFAFDVEMIVLANRYGYRVAEVPVIWKNSPDSRVHIIRDSMRMLLDVLLIRARLGRYRG